MTRSSAVAESPHDTVFKTRRSAVAESPCDAVLWKILLSFNLE